MLPDGLIWDYIKSPSFEGLSVRRETLHQAFRRREQDYLAANWWPKELRVIRAHKKRYPYLGCFTKQHLSTALRLLLRASL